MEGVMNAFAQTSARALSGSKLDNRRVLAALIDLAIVGVGGAAILVAAGVLGGDGASLGAPLAGVVLAWALYYYFALESGGGQTVGKKLMRLRVVRVDGRAAGMHKIAVRTVLRVVDTALVGLIAMMATGERRARLGDLAAGTMIVSTDGAPSTAPAVTAPVVAEEPETLDEPEPVGEEPAEVEDLEPARGYEPITGLQPVDEVAPEPVVEVAPEPVVEVAPVEEVAPEPVVDVAPVLDTEPVVEVAPIVEPEPVVEVAPVADPEPAPDSPPAAEHTLDVATPSLKELAQDVAAATGAEQAAEAAPEPVVEPQPEPRPLAEVEIGGPEIDVDEPQVTVRSVDTVSAIDLVMGADDPSEDRPAADSPPAGA
jgi:uncharacterized RDD family membrane protein YckC